MKCIAVTILIHANALLANPYAVAEIREPQFAAYDNCIEEARKHASGNFLDSALHYYDAAFKIFDFVPYDYFDAFELAVQSNNLEKAYRYFSKGTACGLEVQLYYTESLTFFLKTEQYEKYLGARDSLQQVYWNSIDTVYLKALELLKLADQYNRSGDSLSILTDRLNFDALLELVDQRGFPTLRKVGLGYNIAYLLLWHHRDGYPDSDQWQQIIPIIEEEIRKGEVTPMFFQTFNAVFQGDWGN